MCRRSTGPGVGVKTSEPGTRFSAGAPGKSAGSSGLSATVDVAGLGDEALVVAIRDGAAVDPEPVDADAMDRSLLRLELLRPHQELAARHPDHLRAGGVRRGGCVGQLVTPEVSLSMMSPIVKLAGSWRGGKSLNVSSILAT